MQGPTFKRKKYFMIFPEFKAFSMHKMSFRMWVSIKMDLCLYAFLNTINITSDID